jgi:ABC-type bacteriocin/lantibiotic exporter with double-glycine peptidase domain
MEMIKQRRSKDCGAACIAMIAGVEYERAYAALYKWEKPWAADIDAMKTALKRLGIKSAKQRQSVFGKPEKYLGETFDALLFSNHRKSANEGHWIVWDSKNQRYLDPLPKPYKNPRIHSYLKIFR